MVVHFHLARILPVSISVSVVLLLAVSAAPVRAGHDLTHPAAVAATAPENASESATQATGQSADHAGALFQRPAAIKIKKDAKLYITSRRVPKNDPLLELYNTDRSHGGRVQPRSAAAATVPGLLSIANQVHRDQGQNNRAYSLADAMRDAIWRKETAARLKALTAVPSACVGGGDTAAKAVPPISLDATC